MSLMDLNLYGWVSGGNRTRASVFTMRARYHYATLTTVSNCVQSTGAPGGARTHILPVNGGKLCPLSYRRTGTTFSHE